jgi:hypothetical protein
MCWSSAAHYLTLALDGGEWSASRPGRFTTKERAHGTHWIAGWVGPRAGLDKVVKRKITSHCRDWNPPIVQPLAQRYMTELSRLLFMVWCLVKHRHFTFTIQSSQLNLFHCPSRQFLQMQV